MFWITTVYQMYLFQILFQLCGLSSLCLDVVFRRAVSILKKFSLSFISFMDHALGVITKSHHHSQGHLDFRIGYLLEFYSF